MIGIKTSIKSLRKRLEIASRRRWLEKQCDLAENIVVINKMDYNEVSTSQDKSKNVDKMVSKDVLNFAKIKKGKNTSPKSRLVPSGRKARQQWKKNV